MRKIKIFEWTLILMLLAVVQMVGVLTYWIIRPYNIVEIKNSPYPIVTPVVKAGGTLTYHVDFCIKKSYPATIRQSFSDHIVISLPERRVQLPVGCHSVNVDMAIPVSIPQGTYTLSTFAQYKVNPIRTVEYSSQTQEFKVIR